MEISKSRKEGIVMVEQDTIKLLRECDAGVKMGVKIIFMPYSAAVLINFSIISQCISEKAG